MADNRYCIDYDKLGKAGCKKCKRKIDKGSLRIAKVVANFFSDGGGEMKQWYHVPCIFETFKRARATTKKIDEPDDLEGWQNVKPEDRKQVMDHIKEHEKAAAAKSSPAKKAVAKPKPKPAVADVDPGEGTSSEEVVPGGSDAERGRSQSPTCAKSHHEDNTFRQFRRLCAEIAEESSYTGKTKIVSEFFTNGSSGKGFKGDLELWLTLLMPRDCKRVYNIQNKQLVKLFSQIFDTPLDDMIEDLEQGDVAETIRMFFEDSPTCTPLKKSTLTLQQVDQFLEELTQLTREDEQIHHLRKITKKCSSNDLKMIIRLIKHDLRINTGAKHILNGIHPDAYECFQNSHNLKAVLKQIRGGGGKGGKASPLKVGINLMMPIRPMLAEACKSVEKAFKKFPGGMFAEIKYDGERVQLHKKGQNFKFFSRSLKPVLPHKVEHLRDYIPRAFPSANDLILDSEVLMVDTHTGEPLPFGTLGKHKKEAFKSASVCLFVFDCIFINGKSLINEPIIERHKILHKNMKELKNHVMFSEAQKITESSDLRQLISEVLNKGLEGVVLKGFETTYEPGKRHWLKVKKDYLEEGAMADTADLAVLGAYYGTGNKGGIMSIFLMGCYDPTTKKWCTVAKVHGGHDDETLKKLQHQLDMVKISKNVDRVPNWLNIKKPLVPDFICKDPKHTQIWEITGAEFSKAESHTAGGISIRFPRVTRIRHDKTWKEATTLKELKHLFVTSKKCPNISLGSKKRARSSSPSGPPRKKEEDEEEQEEEDTSMSHDGSHDEDSDGPSTSLGQPMKKKARRNLFDDEKPICMQKKAKYSSDDEKPICKFPSVFSGIKLFLPETLDRRDLLKRYLVAYDMELLDSFHKSQATHFLQDDSKNNDDSDSKPRLSVDWLWDSVKLQKLQPTAPYIAA